MFIYKVDNNDVIIYNISPDILHTICGGPSLIPSFQIKIELLD